MTREAMRLKNKKRKLWRAYTCTQDDICYARYVRCKNLRCLTRNLRRNFEKKLASSLKDNPKGFWRYASTRMKTKREI